MRIYLAGLFCNNLGAWPIMNENKAPFRDFVYPWHLESYHYIGKGAGRGVDRIRRYAADMRTTKIFLDSGAFSAFTLGATIDKSDYANFIETNQDIIEVASVLDAIGDPIKTLENQNWFDERGIDVLPCFHFGEPVEYLRHYIKKYPRITLGGMVPIDKGVLRGWLDHLFADEICDSDGVPKVQVHGFGMTTWDLLFRYPWHSVDSTSYASGSKLGSIYMLLNDKQYIVCIAEGAESEKELDQAFTSLPKIIQDVIEEEVIRLGYTIDGLRASYALRDRFNCEYFERLQLKGIDRFVRPVMDGGLF